ncbi:MAG: DUF2312 domain-containing protein [Holosporaceae bacterium]|nr:MAG: DUF2312 domain-containing protein [Holosporaceae bacterium]
MSYVGGVSKEQLKTIIERIERLEEEKAGLASDIKEVYAEARANGYDVKTLRSVVKIRKIDFDDRQAQEEMLDLYLNALGMLPGGTPATSEDAAEKNRGHVRARLIRNLYGWASDIGSILWAYVDHILLLLKSLADSQFWLNLLHKYKYWIVILGALLEGEMVLLLAGGAAFHGYMNVHMVMLISFLGHYFTITCYFYRTHLWKASFKLFPPLGISVFQR